MRRDGTGSSSSSPGAIIRKPSLSGFRSASRAPDTLDAKGKKRHERHPELQCGPPIVNYRLHSLRKLMKNLRFCVGSGNVVLVSMKLTIFCLLSALALPYLGLTQTTNDPSVIADQSQQRTERLIDEFEFYSTERGRLAELKAVEVRFAINLERIYIRTRAHWITQRKEDFIPALDKLHDAEKSALDQALEKLKNVTTVKQFAAVDKELQAALDQAKRDFDNSTK